MTGSPETAAFANTFQGTERFEVLDQLGAGSMCVVYKVRDRRHGDVVALKTLRHLDSNSLYRLKQEFRALSHFDHPNLVSFSELVNADAGWFVTMELVEGVDFLTFCRGDEPDRESRTQTGTADTWGTSTETDLSFNRSAPAGAAARDATPAPPPKRKKRSLPDLIRLRSSMRQLAEGVHTLHTAGRIHRDLKPSNVLVTDAGRVVILDFGLVAEIDQDYTEGTLHQNIAGSAAYMSPEQSVGRPLTEASDWYSVGVMLYEALTGVWPYSGHLYQILTKKQEEDPPAPSAHVDGVPPELEDLCVRLLSRDPEKRPDAAEVLRVFRSRALVSTAETRVRAQPRFRYRNPENHELLQGFQAAKWGRAVTMLLRGPAGIGKTTLVREFIKSLKRRDEVVILKSRCFEWESVPYKALDGLMDNLSRALRRLDHREVSKLANPGLPYLATLFPVLERVDAFGLTEPADLHRLDPPALRQRAFEGLFELLRELARTVPVLVFIDDVQWGDPESAGVLGEILRFATDIPVFVLLAYQADEPSVFIRRFVTPVQEAGVDVRSLDLDPMSFEQACVIASEMLGMEASDERVRRIAIESGGVPQFIKELARQLEFQDSRATVVEDELNEITVAEIKQLPDPARHLLHVLALCEEPLPTEVAMVSADLGAEAFKALTTLRAMNLMSVTGALGGDTLEIGSEKVREYVLDRIQDDWRVLYHGRIANAMEARGEFDPERLVHHYAGAQLLQKAALVAWLSADDALNKGRVHEAIWLLERAREYGDWNNRERRTILSRLADAHAKVGAGKQAAEAYLEASGDAPAARARELLHRAAEELIGCGQVEEGTRILSQLMSDAGVRVAGSGWFGGSLHAMRRMRLRWRGVDFTSQAEATLSIEDLLKVDLCWTHAMGLALVDVEKGAIAQTVHLEQALEKGEPERALRALAVEVRFRAEAGDADWRDRYEHVLAQAKKIGSKQAIARATYSCAIANLNEGVWVEAASLAESAEHVLAHSGIGAAWERFLCRSVEARAHMSRGDFRKAAEKAIPLVRELEQVENHLFLVILQSTVMAWLSMAEDAPETAQVQLSETASLLAASVDVPFFHLVVAWTHLELYRGRPRAAWEYLEERWEQVQAGMTAAPPLLRVELWLTRARACVAMAQSGGDTSGMLKKARAATAQARKGDPGFSAPWIALLETAMARLEGGPDRVPGSVVADFQKSDQSLGGAVAMFLIDETQKDAAKWMLDQGIRNPERMTRALAPGLI
ncbi:MAG: protein kinase [Alphaproteobacteria bacterium]|nr:protein kinase [Alphaproteobacteria bacterium]